MNFFAYCNCSLMDESFSKNLFVKWLVRILIGFFCRGKIFKIYFQGSTQILIFSSRFLVLCYKSLFTSFCSFILFIFYSYIYRVPTVELFSYFLFIKNNLSLSFLHLRIVKSFASVLLNPLPLYSIVILSISQYSLYSFLHKMYTQRLGTVQAVNPTLDL